VNPLAARRARASRCHASSSKLRGRVRKSNGSLSHGSKVTRVREPGWGRAKTDARSFSMAAVKEKVLLEMASA
jgi:hypothetical protein